MKSTAYILCTLLAPCLGAQPDATKASTGPAVEEQKLLSRDSESVLFETPPAVETAALYAQTLQEAPANVTVITARQIRAYGYRTLAEVLSNVRGFFTTSDGGFSFLGVRGFGLPGDYNMRILVMLNGHYLTDNVYGAMYMFGQDFGLDMDLVQRIEIVRGPSSAMYGSNGMFATINIFTRAPADAPRAFISTEFGSFGEKKSLFSTSAYLGRGANLLLAGSGFHTGGRTIESAELGNSQTGSVGNERGYHTFAQLTWRNWSVTANFSDRKAIIPIGWYGADYGATGTRSSDAHNFIEAAVTKPLGSSGDLRWRVYYDQFRYYGRYDYTEDGVTWDERDYAQGDWLGTRLSYRRNTGAFSGLTFGTQVNADVRNNQISEYVTPEYERYRDTRRRNNSYGVFTQYERPLSKNWILFGGVRFDDSRLDKPFVSPKLAAIWKTSQRTSYKFMYGRAFRNPSTFERFWEPNPLLRAESMNTFEIAREQRVLNRLDIVASVFHYRIAGLIEGAAISDNVLQYRNVSSSRATGFDLEASGQPARWIELSASLSVQRSRYAHPQTQIPNSPAKLAYFRASSTVARNRITLSAAARYMSSRLSPLGFRVNSAVLGDVTATTNRLHRNFDLQVGVRNVADRRYVDPLSTEHLIGVLPRAGRSVYFKLIWQHGE